MSLHHLVEAAFCEALDCICWQLSHFMSDAKWSLLLRNDILFGNEVVPPPQFEHVTDSPNRNKRSMKRKRKESELVD